MPRPRPSKPVATAGAAQGGFASIAGHARDRASRRLQPPVIPKVTLTVLAAVIAGWKPNRGAGGEAVAADDSE
jgi:hypothetical protein